MTEPLNYRHFPSLFQQLPAASGAIVVAGNIGGSATPINDLRSESEQ